MQELLDGAVAAHGDRPAFTYRGSSLTYRAFADHAARAAAGFLRLGIGRTSAVALLLPNTPYHPISFFGALRAGAHIVHLSPLDAERELAHKLEDSGARTLVTTNLFGLVAKAQKLLAGGHVDRVIVGDDAAWGPAAAPPDALVEAANVIDFARASAAAAPARWPDVSRDDVAVLQYTGATTGVPKAAMLTHANLTAAVSSYREWGRARAGAGRDRVIMVLPLFHIYGLCSIMLRHLASAERADAAAAFRRRGGAARHRGGARDVVPGRSDDVDRADQSSGDRDARLLLVAGGRLRAARRCRSRWRNVAERITGLALPSGWGMTETSPAGISPPPNGPPKPGTIGLPLPGIVVEVVAVDDPHRVLGAGEVGELRIKGRNVMTGLLEPAGGDRRRLRGRLLPHRRHRHHGRRTATSSCSTASTT